MTCKLNVLASAAKRLVRLAASTIAKRFNLLPARVKTGRDFFDAGGRPRMLSRSRLDHANLSNFVTTTVSPGFRAFIRCLNSEIAAQGTRQGTFSPLALSSEGAKLFLATLNEVLTSLDSLHRPRLPEKSLRMASGKEISMSESNAHRYRWPLPVDLVPDLARRHRRKVDVTIPVDDRRDLVFSSRAG